MTTSSTPQTGPAKKRRKPKEASAVTRPLEQMFPETIATYIRKAEASGLLPSLDKTYPASFILRSRLGANKEMHVL